ncbi:beta-lactamase family protein [Actinoplanes sp. LDG1-06]|uniref:Beta-lactamase family protein n=1 Tax=Paractinoplanes ovalisporus TaxID=2810368 RepID=A0ABS2A5U2_9ACTN|nr:serine hydrolase domain-containing protein [Actinoplanes ovalisporus]MBM2614659.1 beta-lactamase family protein [Actinoplanes ovalisporus]
MSQFVISRTRRAAVACLAGLTLFTSAPAFSAAAAVSPTPAQIQRLLDQVVAAGAPGAIAVVRTGGRTIRLAAGRSVLDPAAPMRPGLRSRFGGVTKSYTATVVLQLVAEHRLSLGDTVERRLPGVLPNGGAITIRQLLNHTSGVFDYVQDPRTLAPYLAGDLTRIFDPRDGLRYAAEHGPLFPPGTGLAYSNTNSLLLAMIVESVTGRSFATELRRRLFVPLGLAGADYPDSSPIAGPHVHGYTPDAPPMDITALSPTLYGASGALVSNAEDVARFFRALLRGQLLPARVLAQMKTIDPVATGGTPDSGILGGGWGLGLLRESFPCGTAWGHDSEIPGYTTAAWSSPDADRQVVVVVNSFYDHDAPVNQALRRLLITAMCAG